MVSSDRIALVWQKASVAGGLWAAVEIIVGSFLHNLRIPFSGSILAFFGTIILIAFSRIWPEKGVIWRAGLICALMKSISPSAVILGPMTGIFAEALLLQLFVNLFGRNLAGYITGGIFSLMSALFHKVISLLILYGLDLFRIYLNIYYFAARQINIGQADPWVLVAVLVGAYVVFGVLSAFLGNYIGKRVLLSESMGTPAEGASHPVISQAPSDQPGKYSLTLLTTHLLALPVCLYFVNQPGWHMGLIAPVVYCLFVILTYPAHLRRLTKPFFWFQILMVTVLAVLFWTNAGDGSASRWQGLWVGLQLNFRAVLVILSFTAISVELKNPLIQRFLVSHGFASIYLSLNLAFSILPVMMKSLGRGRSFITKPLATLIQALSRANQWLGEVVDKQKDL